jgi:hypothetical protein
LVDALPLPWQRYLPQARTRGSPHDRCNAALPNLLPRLVLPLHLPNPEVSRPVAPKELG